MTYTYRFIEKDYFRSIIKGNSDFLTNDEIDELLSEHRTWEDVSIEIKETNFRLNTVFIDNITDEIIEFEDISKAAQIYTENILRKLRKNRVKSLLSKDSTSIAIV